MDGLKEALQYAAELNKPEVLELNGRTYTSKGVFAEQKDSLASGLKCSTLDAKSQYLNANIDKID